MPRKVTDLQILQRYIQGVMERAEHHAGGVDEICLAIAGAIIWTKSGDIEVFEREGEMKNVLWVNIDNKRYAFTYEHDTDSIDIKEGSTQGDVIISFTNENTAGDVKNFFSSL